MGLGWLRARLVVRARGVMDKPERSNGTFEASMRSVGGFVADCFYQRSRRHRSYWVESLRGARMHDSRA